MSSSRIHGAPWPTLAAPITCRRGAIADVTRLPCRGQWPRPWEGNSALCLASREQRPDRADNPARLSCRHRPYLPSTARCSTLHVGELPCGDGRTPHGGPRRRGAPAPSRRGSTLAMQRQRDGCRGSALAALRETVVRRRAPHGAAYGPSRRACLPRLAALLDA
jgi:hypothetical protein